MEVLEGRRAWERRYAGFLDTARRIGRLRWKDYPLPRNRSSPSGPGIDLATARLMLISSAGGYLEGEQVPFDTLDPQGDYTVRRIPSSIDPTRLRFAHGHYDPSAVEEDPQVLFPLHILQNLQRQGWLGVLTPSVVSFMGFQPHLGRLIDETIPAIQELAREEEVQAALLVPA